MVKKIVSVRHLKSFLEKELGESIDVTPDMSKGFTIALKYIKEVVE